MERPLFPEEIFAGQVRDRLLEKVTEETGKHGKNSAIVGVTKHFLKVFEKKAKSEEVDVNGIDELFDIACLRAFMGGYELGELVEVTYSAKYLHQIERNLLYGIRRKEKEKHELQWSLSADYGYLKRCREKIEWLESVFGE